MTVRVFYLDRDEHRDVTARCVDVIGGMVFIDDVEFASTREGDGPLQEVMSGRPVSIQVRP